ncbi:S-methyl-5-thioribose kinase [Clostridiaceae bacterium M8S5]|nr:S-methyl-5-thioribose kinase [Clostridiaceae bacterium M8S5]
MTDKNRFDEYFLMQEEDAVEYVKKKLNFFEDTSNLQCKEIGDGNLNYVFKIVDKNTGKSLILKHSGEDTRAKSGRKLNIDRNISECKILQMQGELCSGYVPVIYMYDEIMNCYAMEDLSDYKIMRKALLENNIYKHFAQNITTFMVNTLLPTTDIVMDHKKKKEMVKQFTNIELCDISEQLVFTEPAGNFLGENTVIPAMSKFVQDNIYKDKKLRLEIGKLKFNFMNNTQALIHGDLHSGSIFIDEKEIKVIDPEFAFFGPIGYDVGNIVANLLLAWGHGYATIEDSKEKYDFLSWLEQCVTDIIDIFKEKFNKKYKTEVTDLLAKTDGFDEYYLDSILSDTAGTAGLEIIRRIVGIAKVEDITSIQDEHKRAEVEKILIRVGKEFILNRDQYKTGMQYVQTLKKFVN